MRGAGGSDAAGSAGLSEVGGGDDSVPARYDTPYSCAVGDAGSALGHPNEDGGTSPPAWFFFSFRQ